MNSCMFVCFLYIYMYMLSKNWIEHGNNLLLLGMPPLTPFFCGSIQMDSLPPLTNLREARDLFRVLDRAVNDYHAAFISLNNSPWSLLLGSARPPSRSSSSSSFPLLLLPNESMRVAVVFNSAKRNTTATELTRGNGVFSMTNPTAVARNAIPPVSTSSVSRMQTSYFAPTTAPALSPAAAAMAAASMATSVFPSATDAPGWDSPAWLRCEYDYPALSTSTSFGNRGHFARLEVFRSALLPLIPLQLLSDPVLWVRGALNSTGERFLSLFGAYESTTSQKGDAMENVRVGEEEKEKEKEGDEKKFEREEDVTAKRQRASKEDREEIRLSENYMRSGDEGQLAHMHKDQRRRNGPSPQPQARASWPELERDTRVKVGESGVLHGRLVFEEGSVQSPSAIAVVVRVCRGRMLIQVCH